MNKTLKKIKSVITTVFLTIYFLTIIVTSTMLLSRNDYGISQIKDKYYIKITRELATNKYKEGSLVVVDSKNIRELSVGEEVFIYSVNYDKNRVDVVISNIKNLNFEDKNNYITLEETNTSWGEEYIIGTHNKTYNNIGKILEFLETKWIFFILLIIPCFFILIYEVYLLVKTIKYDDEIDEKETLQILENIQNNKPLDEREDKIEALTQELKDLKNEIKKQKEVEKIDNLMEELIDLKEEIEESE